MSQRNVLLPPGSWEFLRLSSRRPQVFYSCTITLGWEQEETNSTSYIVLTTSIAHVILDKIMSIFLLSRPQSSPLSKWRRAKYSRHVRQGARFFFGSPMLCPWWWREKKFQMMNDVLALLEDPTWSSPLRGLSKALANVLDASPLAALAFISSMSRLTKVCFFSLGASIVLGGTWSSSQSIDCGDAVRGVLHWQRARPQRGGEKG